MRQKNEKIFVVDVKKMEIVEGELDDFLADFDIDGDGGELKVDKADHDGWSVFYRSRQTSWKSLNGDWHRTKEEAQEALLSLEREMKIRRAEQCEDVMFFYSHKEAEAALAELIQEEQEEQEEQKRKKLVFSPKHY
jgi:hypothetical protein